MNEKHVRTQTSDGRQLETRSTMALVILAVGCAGLLIASALHAVFGLFADLVTGAF